MTWIEKRKNWITSGGRLQRPKEEVRPRSQPHPRHVVPDDGPLWTVADIARVLKLHPDTVYKFVSNMPAGAVFRVPPGPTGQIRVRDWAVQQLLEEV